MNLIRERFSSTLFLTALLLIGAGRSAVFSQPGGGESGNATYSIQITNLTTGQVFSPPLAAGHSELLAVFWPGQPASAELAILAEDGNPMPLSDALNALDGVDDVATAGGPVLPGATVELMLEGMPTASKLSVVSMLVNSNDAFAGINSISPPRSVGRVRTIWALAYDAGSEADNESCDFIPGPACAGAGAGVRATDGAEGFVSISSGIHGSGDLSADRYDWRNPVAMIRIERVN